MLRQRIISAIAMLLALFAATLLLPSIGVMILVMLLGFLGLIEYDRLLRHAGIEPFTKTMLAGGLLLTGGAYLDAASIGFPSFPWEIAGLAVCLLLMTVQALRRTPDVKTLAAVGGAMLGLLYLPVMLNFLMRLAILDDQSTVDAIIHPRLLALFPIVTVKASDMGAYFAGRRFGHRKLCPRLSPGKTWAGLAGGLAVAGLIGLVFALLAPSPDGIGPTFWKPLPLALCAILLATVGVFGDLSESFLKRVTGVKDSSGVLPGMGGVLDVLDSLLFCAPVFYILVRMAGI